MRSRNIKPAFFKNEDLADIDTAARLLFIGLWCLADKNGLIEHRPKRIKAEIFPYEPEHDVNGYITVLSRLGFIRVLTDGDKEWLLVENFITHQNPHHTEKTKNPDPNSLKEKGKEEITVTPPLSTGDTPADSLLLIPDSLSTDSCSGEASPSPKRKSKKGSRLDVDTLPDEWETFCRDNRPDLHPHSVFEQFKDYWAGVAGAKGVKLDWLATWRNWVRNQKGQSNGAHQQNTTSRAKQVSDKLDEIARRDIAENGFTSSLG
jgi:hypothetical protein